MKTLYTAVATANDAGRNGRTRTDDGSLDLQLTMPEGMGGSGGDGAARTPTPRAGTSPSS